MTLTDTADAADAVCAFLNLPPGVSTSTIEPKTDFFGAVRPGSVHAEARPVHGGRSRIAARRTRTTRTAPWWAGRRGPRR